MKKFGIAIVALVASFAVIGQTTSTDEASVSLSTLNAKSVKIELEVEAESLNDNKSLFPPYCSAYFQLWNSNIESGKPIVEFLGKGDNRINTSDVIYINGSAGTPPSSQFQINISPMEISRLKDTVLDARFWCLSRAQDADGVFYEKGDRGINQDAGPILPAQTIFTIVLKNSETNEVLTKFSRIYLRTSLDFFMAYGTVVEIKE